MLFFICFTDWERCLRCPNLQSMHVIINLSIIIPRAKHDMTITTRSTNKNFDNNVAYHINFASFWILRNLNNNSLIDNHWSSTWWFSCPYVVVPTSVSLLLCVCGSLALSRQLSVLVSLFLHLSVFRLPSLTGLQPRCYNFRQVDYYCFFESLLGRWVPYFLSSLSVCVPAWWLACYLWFRLFVCCL